MTPEHWEHVATVVQEALDRPTSEREAFLDAACVGDDDLRRRVQSLIAYFGSSRDFLEMPLLEVLGRMAEEPDQGLEGSRLGSYQIESRLGSGGMGDVYLAVDTTLDRKVAIKFLPRALEADELARGRQIREAKAAAGLDHPNICAIYEVATLAGRSCIVMQYIEGDTLAQTLQRRALSLREAVDVGIEIADALALAHARGIVHRDIKPQNVMITPRGQVKVLDFGLAKRLKRARPEQPPEAPAADPSALGTLTQPGRVIGTAPYMSPEQVRGEDLDGRSDLFSLGALLYQCASRQPAFAGSTPLEICASVIHVDPPPPSALNSDVPPALDRIILKALAKDRNSRQASVEDLRNELVAVRDALLVHGTSSGPLPVASQPRPVNTLTGIARRPVVLAAAVVVILIAAGVLLWRPATPHRPPREALEWYERGTAALRDGTYYKASKALEQAIAFDDKFALAHARLAEAWSELDYANRASREILRAQSLVPDLSPLPPGEALHLQAITHVVLQQFGPAVQLYEKLAAQAPAGEKARAYVDLGRAQEQHDEITNAQNSYKQAAALATQDAAAYLRLGMLYGRQQNLKAASEAFETAEKLYRALSNVEGEAEVFYQRGFLFKNLNQLDAARAQLDEALKLSANPINPFQYLRTLLVLSGVSAAEGNSLQAEQQASQAIQLARDNGIANQATNGLIWLGNVLLNRGDYGGAEKRYTQALELAQRDNGRLNEAIALFSLGSLRSQQRRTDDALQYVERAIPPLQQGGYRKWLAVASTLLGRIHRDRGEYDPALQVFKDQVTQAEQVGDTSQLALAHAEIGGVLARQEQYVNALAAFDRSYALSKSLNATISIGYALMYRAGVLWQMGRFEEAAMALDEATVIAGPGGVHKGLLAEIYLTGAGLDLAAGRVGTAKVKSRKALGLAGEEYADTAAQATATLGLAEARSGAAGAGAVRCAEAVDRAARTGDPQLVASARLALAEAQLASGQAGIALQSAQRILESVARSGQLDSEWRAWLIASDSRRRLGDAAAARESASNAAARLAELEQRLGPGTFQRFAARPDVLAFRKQLHQQLTP